MTTAKAKPETSDLTKEEQARVRTALRFLRIRFEGWGPLGKALRVRQDSLGVVGRGGAVTASMAFRVARLVKVGIDDLLAGAYPHPNACPHCGHVPGMENDGPA
jgi:hypothetical protein